MKGPYRVDVWRIYWYLPHSHVMMPKCPVGAPLYIAQGNTLGGWHVIGEVRPVRAKGLVEGNTKTYRSCILPPQPVDATVSFDATTYALGHRLCDVFNLKTDTVHYIQCDIILGIANILP